MYQDELDLTTTTIQAVFGLYVLGLIPGLLLGGPVSDRYGRRRVMAPTLAASVVATGLLMLGGTGIGWLFAGRLVAGVASGAAFSSGAAWIKELSGATGGARRVTVAMTAGFGLGPLVAGVLAQWARAPTVLPYAPHLVLAAVAFRPVLRASETRRPGRLTGLRQQFRIPEIRTHRFRAVAARHRGRCRAGRRLRLLPGVRSARGPAHGAARSPGRADCRVPGDLLPGLCRAVPARVGCPGRAG